MKLESKSQYIINDEKEKSLWENAIIVFDSSSLLDFYFVPKKSREKIYDEIFKKLEQRLWIPNHVQFEYLKNREKIISKPISEKYTPLKDKVKAFETTFQKEYVRKIESIQKETEKDDRHPHIAQDKIDAYKNKINDFLDSTKQFHTEIISQISESENEVNALKDNDDVLKSLEEHFDVGVEFSFEDILAITKEGKHRYEFKIPPGYGDYYNKQKKGTQIFGDLIIWKEILNYSKSKECPIIFITNDIKKDEDWCYLDTKNKDRISSPREELIKEIKDYAGVDFWMYSFSQFLFNSNKYLESSIEEEVINQISIADNPEDDIYDDYYTCDECDGKDGYGNYVNFWNYIDLENEYPEEHAYSKFTSAKSGSCEWCNTLHIKCPKCESVTCLSENQQNERIECAGGCGLVFFVDTSEDFEGVGEKTVKIIDNRVVECISCGDEFIDLNHTETCDECERKYNED